MAPQLVHADPEKADRGTYRMKFTSRWVGWRTPSAERIAKCKDDNIVPGVKLLEVQIDEGVTVNGRPWTYDGKVHGHIVARTTRPGKRLMLHMWRGGGQAEALLVVEQGDETSSCMSSSHFEGTYR